MPRAVHRHSIAAASDGHQPVGVEAGKSRTAALRPVCAIWSLSPPHTLR